VGEGRWKEKEVARSPYLQRIGEGRSLYLSPGLQRKGGKAMLKRKKGKKIPKLPWNPPSKRRELITTGFEISNDNGTA